MHEEFPRLKQELQRSSHSINLSPKIITSILTSLNAFF